MPEAPILETSRLILRGWRESDLDGFAAMMADSQVARFLSADGRGLDRANAWRAMALYAGHWTLKGFGLFVVEEKGTGAFVGRIGPWSPEGWYGFEIGWALARPYWGRGYAVEAARAGGDWAIAQFGLTDLVSLIHIDNKRSQATAGRVGFAPGARTMHAGMPHVIWRASVADWRAAAPV